MGDHQSEKNKRSSDNLNLATAIIWCAVVMVSLYKGIVARYTTVYIPEVIAYAFLGTGLIKRKHQLCIIGVIILMLSNIPFILNSLLLINAKDMLFSESFSADGTTSLIRMVIIAISDLMLLIAIILRSRNSIVLCILSGLMFFGGNAYGIIADGLLTVGYLQYYEILTVSVARCFSGPCLEKMENYE